MWLLKRDFLLKQVWLSFIFVGNSIYMILQKVCCGILFFRLVIIGDSLTIMCYLAINEFLYSFSCSLIKLVTQPPPSHMSIGYILIPHIYRIAQGLSQCIHIIKPKKAHMAYQEMTVNF